MGHICFARFTFDCTFCFIYFLSYIVFCDGAGWSEWSEYSQCSLSCEQGTQSRSRKCLPDRDGLCRGLVVESRACSLEPCPSWSLWSNWGECTTSCGIGQESRLRQCLNMEKKSVDGGCLGLGVLTRTCMVEPCPIGEWNTWTNFSTCSTTCGIGERLRKRSCDDGVCPGPGKEVLACNHKPCPAKWAKWMPWTPCIPVCGFNRHRNRMRLCVGIGGQCDGNRTETTDCKNVTCPGIISSSWTPWTAWSACNKVCGNGRRERTRKCLACVFEEECIHVSKDCQPRSSATNICNQEYCKSCVGSEIENLICNRDPCPPAIESLEKFLPPNFMEILQSMIQAIFGHGTLSSIFQPLSQIPGLGFLSNINFGPGAILKPLQNLFKALPAQMQRSLDALPKPAQKTLLAEAIGRAVRRMAS